MLTYVCARRWIGTTVAGATVAAIGTAAIATTAIATTAELAAGVVAAGGVTAAAGVVAAVLAAATAGVSTAPLLAGGAVAIAAVSGVAVLAGGGSQPAHWVPGAPPTTWTILQNNDPNHLGLRCNALPEHQMALIYLGMCVLTDGERKSCVGCTAVFGTFTRKHHCRSCGEVFCDSCASPDRMSGERACSVACTTSVQPAAGEAVILLHSPLPVVGVSMWIERGWQ